MFPLNLFGSGAYTWIFRAEYDSFSCPLYARTDPQPRKATIAARPRLRQVPSLVLHLNQPSLELARPHRGLAPHTLTLQCPEKCRWSERFMWLTFILVDYAQRMDRRLAYVCAL